MDDSAPEAFGRAGGVHGDVAAADGGNAFAMQDGGIGARELVGRHEVDAGEVLVGGIDAFEVLAGHVHEDRQAGAVGDEHSIKLGAQLLQSVSAANDGVADDLHPGLLQAAHFGLDDLLGETKFRDAVHQHAARFVEGLEHSDIVAELGQFTRRGESARPGADHGDLLASGRSDLKGLLVVMAARPIADVSLQVTNRHGQALIAADALDLALGFLRAHAAGDGGDGVVFEKRLRGSGSFPCDRGR